MRRSRRIGLSLLALPVGGFVAWLVLLAALHLPSESPVVWFGLPVVALAALGLLITRRLPWLGIALMAGGVATLVFFAWLFTMLPGADF